jgi:hypothetical protein
MKRSKIAWIAGFFLAFSSLPAWAADVPQPGTINYVEGQASLNGAPLPNNIGGDATLYAGQDLVTQNGRAEVLLTPGIFLRTASRSTVEMVSPGLADTVVTLKQGRALVEVAAIYPENNVIVNEDGAQVRLLKPGLYEFDADRQMVRVFEGKAQILDDGHQKDIGNSHELNVGPATKLKSEHFERAAYQDDFYRWSSLRASYIADANIDAASRYEGQPAWSNGWVGTGWYWDPWYSAYTFIPGDGLFYSPFGWGFYSPWYAPYYGYWGGVGFGGYHHFGPGYQPHPMTRAAVGMHAGPVAGSGGAAFSHGYAAGGGMRSSGFAAGGMRSFGGGGFHGGGGRR